jgi:hypothetical protein
MQCSTRCSARSSGTKASARRQRVGAGIEAQAAAEEAEELEELALENDEEPLEPWRAASALR